MNFKEHAEREMRLAGLYDEDADYNGLIPEAVMALVETHAAQGHSHASHLLTLMIFNKVINYQTLTPITSNPDEWVEVELGTWQSKRSPSHFSRDGGKTFYDINERNS